MSLKACGRMTTLDRSCRVAVGVLLLLGALLSLASWYYVVLALMLLFSGLAGQCLMAKWVKECK